MRPELDPSLRWLTDMPKLSDPIMVVMMSGWIDAANSARAACDALIEESSASPFAELDDDCYLDFRARRPTMELRDGHHSTLDWQRTLLSYGTDQTQQDMVILSGPEPDMRWHQFARTVTSVAQQMGVTKMIHLGAYPFATPHTRPSRLSVSSPSEDMLATVPYLRSSVDVPAGIASALEQSLHNIDIPTLGLWAQVPHYLGQTSYAAASVALLDGLREVTGIVCDATELRAEVITQSKRFKKLIGTNAEHSEMLRSLEELYDDNDGSTETTETAGPSLEIMSGDELAAEFQQFLREQDSD